MSPKPAGASRGPSAWLDRVQSWGEPPVVNPQKVPWEPPEPRRSTAFWVASSFVATLLLVIFWFWFDGGAAGFIYQGF